MWSSTKTKSGFKSILIAIPFIAFAGGNGTTFQKPDVAEITIHQNKLDLGNRSFEIEAVCKLGENSLSCWKPDGQRVRSLDEEIGKSLTQKDGKELRFFEFAAGLKNRVLVMKSTYFSEPLKSSRVYDSMALTQAKKLAKNWRDTYIGDKVITTDNSETYRHFYVGSFEKSATEAPMNFTFLKALEGPVIVTLDKGLLSIDDNLFEITAVDSPTSSQIDAQQLSHQAAYTVIDLIGVKITNPNLNVVFTPIDQNGAEISYPARIDVAAPFDQIEKRPHYRLIFPLEKSKLSSISMKRYLRSTLDFGHIKLDPAGRSTR
ncbi:MAG: hypothetical protein WCG75_02650 [Armatimonadota bacterium]